MSIQYEYSTSRHSCQNLNLIDLLFKLCYLIWFSELIFSKACHTLHGLYLAEFVHTNESKNTEYLLWDTLLDTVCKQKIQNITYVHWRTRLFMDQNKN